MMRASAIPGRKTDRREPGGLERAVLMLVHDGFSTSLKIADILDTSIDNVNGALSRLQYKLCVSASYDCVPRFWTITATGRHKVGDEESWT